MLETSIVLSVDGTVHDVHCQRWRWGSVRVESGTSEPNERRHHLHVLVYVHSADTQTDCQSVTGTAGTTANSAIEWTGTI